MLVIVTTIVAPTADGNKWRNSNTVPTVVSPTDNWSFTASLAVCSIMVAKAGVPKTSKSPEPSILAVCDSFTKNSFVNISVGIMLSLLLNVVFWQTKAELLVYSLSYLQQRVARFQQSVPLTICLVFLLRRLKGLFL